MPDPKDLLGIVNSYGFAFQLRVEDEVRTTEVRHHWQIYLREHPWVDPISQQEAFVDLVLLDGRARMIIECKRVLDANWVFLVPDKEYILTSQSRVLYTMSRKNGETSAEWSDFRNPPASYLSSFCTVMGQTEKDRPLLERISALLIRSVEYLADEELHVPLAGNEYREALYIPTIVTTAKLHVCHFDPSKIDLLRGQIELDHANFEPVEYIRFQKSFSARRPAQRAPTNLLRDDAENERTILVINSNALAGYLTSWDQAR